MKDQIISTIREQIIKLDAGFFLRDDFESFKLPDNERMFYEKKYKVSSSDSKLRNYIILSESDEQFCNNFFNSLEEKLIVDKTNPLSYLTAKTLKTLINHTTYPAFDKSFSLVFKNYWEERVTKLKSLLENAPKYIHAETISDKDLLFINVNEMPEIKLFIISEKYLIMLSLDENGLNDRIEHIIQKDIKRLNIRHDSTLEVHFHGHHEPLSIDVDDYKSALQLQRHLTELRQVR